VLNQTSSGSCSVVVNAVAPTLTGPGGSSSVAFWYLGGAPACCDGLTYKYWVSSTAYLTLNTQNRNPTISWYTDSPSRLSIPNPISGSATLIALGASDFQAGYDIHVWVTVDGLSSNQLPVFINTPSTMTTSGPSQFCNALGCDCLARGYPVNGIGYVALITHGVADRIGNILTPIDLNESLEHQQFFGGWIGQVPPVATPWNVFQWNPNNTISDYLSACSLEGSSPNPPPTAFGLNGTVPILNETQKFWIGSQTHFHGVCVQRGVLTLYTDHGAVSPYYTPILSPADCNEGNVINQP
jgi:hypothetical protein